MPQISVPQKNLTISVENGKNLMDALIEAGLPVASSCFGDGICSKCAVEMSPLGSHSELEIKTLTKNKYDLTKRLCCQVQVNEDLIIKVSYW